jgi:hypothetical protein
MKSPDRAHLKCLETAKRIWGPFLKIFAVIYGPLAYAPAGITITPLKKEQFNFAPALLNRFSKNW